MCLPSSRNGIVELPAIVGSRSREINALKAFTAPPIIPDTVFSARATEIVVVAATSAHKSSECAALALTRRLARFGS